MIFIYGGEYVVIVQAAASEYLFQGIFNLSNTV